MTLFDTPVQRTPGSKALVWKMTEGIGEGWAGIFAKIGDDMFYNIAQQLIEKSEQETICPASIDVFRAFKECKYSRLKVVWVLQDPYHQVIHGTRVADGIAMSCKNTGLLQPSLKLVYDEIGKTVNHERRFEQRHQRQPDLAFWANQGVLMLNTALTVGQGKPGSHTDIWKPFTTRLIRILGEDTSTIWIFSGAHAKGFSKLVKNGTKYFTLHPAAAAYRGGHWDSDDLFNNVNLLLNSRGQDKIMW